MSIPTKEILDLSQSLVSIPSISGSEVDVANYLSDWMSELGWNVVDIPVDGQRKNLFVSFGEPRVVMSTHMDVVPGPDFLFTPQRTSDELRGRGACDAKGCIATMIILAKELLAQGRSNFALLFVVGEEVDGIGAIRALDFLRGRGVKYFINGEPTEGRFAAATKGVLDFELSFSGRSCHSGYPNYGVDANRLLLDCISRLYNADYGSDPVLGHGLINVGVIKAGSAANIVSSSASASCCVRTVESHNERVRQLISDLCQTVEPEFIRDVDAIKLSVPEWEKDPYVAAYVSDVGQFIELGCELFLCGPGTILCAHTDEEKISSQEIQTAYQSYFRLFDTLYRNHLI